MPEIHLDHIAVHPVARGFVCQDLRPPQVIGNHSDVLGRHLFPVKHLVNVSVRNILPCRLRPSTEEGMKREFHDAGKTIRRSGKSGRQRGIAGGD